MSEHSGEPHVTNRFYVVIALILAVLTAMEVMVFYVDALSPVVLPLLLVLMSIKFTLVAMFFMHLRFDSRLLTGIFGWCLFLAASIILALLAVFGKFTA